MHTHKNRQHFRLHRCLKYSQFCFYAKAEKMCLSSHLVSYIDKRRLMCVYVCRKLCMTSIYTEYINWITNFSNRNLIFSKYYM